jgi:cardiolipin synthase
MAHAMALAAERGVDVRVITPGIPDKKMVYSVTRSFYNSLARHGVRMYEWTPGFCHAKMCVADDTMATCGTINLDYRSLYHHFECATYLYRTDCIADIEKDFQNTLAKCREVTDESIKNEKTSYKVTGRLAKMISPLM